jgi:tripeptidyl-peptidase-2
VVIGILDTGIDPGASGLRYMADGVTPKLIDLVDCTGSGDVDIQTERTVAEVVGRDADGPDEGEAVMGGPQDDGYYQVTGLSGRVLKLKKSWWKVTPPRDTGQGEGTAPDDDNKDLAEPTSKQQHLPKVKLGIKPAYEIFPASVVQRVKAHRKHIFEKEVNEYIAGVHKDLATWQERFDGSSNGSQPTPDDLRTKEDLQARLDVLTDKDWETDDPGMILDCVVFWDDALDDYRAVIFGGDEEGADPTPLAAYRKERQYGTISTVDQYNYGVNFYDDGSVLSIVGDCTPHGTHVAAIAAVAEDGDDSRNGVAPGAQLVSIKIGDSRLGSMETGSSIARGIMTAVRLGCDVINLSYGEGCQVPNAGRIVQLAEELVWRHNIVFVSAVGNNGPALSTVNAPGGLSSCILGVGAYVSPAMMRAGHSISSNSTTETPADGEANEADDSLVGSTYTWSSVGPADDGSNGVCICAPGGAITSVSNWTMQKSMHMNGTSMASPHACGCVALLLSASKAEGIPISPPRIQRAIECTAKPMPGLTRMQQGHGMIQVEDAYQRLKATKEDMSEDIFFQVYVDNRPGNPRGIYLRQAEESKTRQSFSVRVNPQFKRKYELDEESLRQRIDFEMQFTISSTEPWVTVPAHLLLMNNGRSFSIDIDPVALPHGVHTANVEGKISGRPERGTIWTLPITVIKPLKEMRVIEQNNIEVRTLGG